MKDICKVTSVPNLFFTTFQHTGPSKTRKLKKNYVHMSKDVPSHCILWIPKIYYKLKGRQKLKEKKSALRPIK